MRPDRPHAFCPWLYAACLASPIACRGAAPRPRESEPAAVVREKPEAESESEGERQWLIGVVGHAGERGCDERGESYWAAVVPTVGFVPVFGLPPSDFDAHTGAAVVVEGVAGVPPAGNTEVTDSGRCPPMQKRDDWVDTPDGFRHGLPGAGIAGFAARSVRPLHELTARRDGADIVVSFTEPLPEPLADVEIVIAYEGCFGKPNRLEQIEAIGPLAPGERAESRRPTIWEREGQRYRAHAVQVRGTSPRAIVRLEVTLGQLGAAVDCDAKG
jgi:hypothetical protein